MMTMTFKLTHVSFNYVYDAHVVGVLQLEWYKTCLNCKKKQAYPQK